jgi:hypothetical protein
MPYNADPRHSYISLDMNMTWVEMHFNDYGKTLEYLGDKSTRVCTLSMLGEAIEDKVRDYVQRKLFWCREEALEKYSAFETVWDLIEDVVYEFQRNHSDLLEVRWEDGCIYCGEEAKDCLQTDTEEVMLCPTHYKRKQEELEVKLS